MSHALQLVQQAARRLQQEGKSVNLALLRGRLAGQLAGAELLQAYQQWRAQPHLPELPALAIEIAESSPPDQNEQLSVRLARIEAKLDRLLKLLDTADVSR